MNENQKRLVMYSILSSTLIHRIKNGLKQQWLEQQQDSFWALQVHCFHIQLSLAPFLLPAAVGFLQGAAATIAVGGTLTSVIVVSLSATAAFLSTSTGLTVLTVGLAAGGATYGGY